MERWQKEHIKTNLTTLLEDTECNDALFNIMLAKGILTESEVAELKSITSDTKRNAKFYSKIQEKAEIYESLVDALAASGQSNSRAGQILRKAIENQNESLSNRKGVISQPVAIPSPSSGTLAVPIINLVPATPPTHSSILSQDIYSHTDGNQSSEELN